jgi:hypothetical protein
VSVAECASSLCAKGEPLLGVVIVTETNPPRMWITCSSGHVSMQQGMVLPQLLGIVDLAVTT